MLTPGEFKALIAPALGLSAEDIKDFAVVVRTPCPDCGQDDNIQTYSSIQNSGQSAFLFTQGVTASIIGDDIDAD
jgi:hypothetical protein